MKVINSITIVHSASRNFKEALDLCIETAKKENIDVKSILPVNEKGIDKGCFKERIRFNFGDRRRWNYDPNSG